MTKRPPPTDVVLYTLPYCPDCRDLGRYLTERDVQFKEVDLVHTPNAVVDMLTANGGRRSVPTVRIGTQVLVDPTMPELDDALRRFRG